MFLMLSTKFADDNDYYFSKD